MLAALSAVSCTSATRIPQAQSRDIHPDVPPLQYKMRKLDNGLTVYSMRDVSSPSVVVSLWYDVGAKHDPEGLTGFAHLFEHLLSRKTVNMPYNAINEIVEGAGGTRNATTGYDFTNYYETVPAAQLERILWTHAERMARAVLDTQVLNSERRAINQEIRETLHVNPYGPPGRLTSRVIPYNSFDSAPHRRAVVGDSAELATATLDDVIAFQEAFYGPETASLIVAGNFDEETLQALVDKYFGRIARRVNPAPVELNISEVPRTQSRILDVFAANVPNTALVSTWKLPPSAHPDHAALSVLNAILTRGDNSRLRRSLIQDGLLTQLSADLRENEDVSYYAVWGIVGPNGTAGAADSALMREVDRIRMQPVTSAELLEARNELLAAALQQRETLLGRSLELGQSIVRMGDPAAADKRLAAILGVDADDVIRVAKRYLDPDTRLLIRYHDESKRGDVEAARTESTPMPRFARLPAPRSTPLTAAPPDLRDSPPPPLPPRSVRAPALSERRLESGVTVVAVNTSEVPVATLTVLIKGGASIDPRGKEGMTALLLDVARRGTASRSAQQIASELEALGATLSVNTEFNTRDIIGGAMGCASLADGALISVTAPVANIEEAAGIVADIVQNAALNQEALEASRTRSLAGIEAVLRTPASLASLVLHRVVYGAAPYGNAGLGTPASIKSIALADLREHYRTWFHPENAAVVIAGGIGTTEAIALAERLFGEWKGDGIPPSLPTERAGNPSHGKTILVDLPTAAQAMVVAAFPAVSEASDDVHSLTVANMTLGVGATSRLFREVRTRRSLSYSPGSWFAPRADAGLLIVGASTRNETAAETAEAILAEFARLQKEPPDAEEIARRKAFTGGVHNLLNERSSSFSAMVASLIQQGVPATAALRYSDDVAKTSSETVNRLVQRFLSPDSANIVIVGDASKIIASLRQLRPNVEVIAANALQLDEPGLKSRQ